MNASKCNNTIFLGNVSRIKQSLTFLANLEVISERTKILAKELKNISS